MLGINQKILDFVERIIGSQFDELLVDFLGIVPKLNDKKKLFLHQKKIA